MLEKRPLELLPDWLMPADVLRLLTGVNRHSKRFAHVGKSSNWNVTVNWWSVLGFWFYVLGCGLMFLVRGSFEQRD
jgi:hypothetical protein